MWLVDYSSTPIRLSAVTATWLLQTLLGYNELINEMRIDCIITLQAPGPGAQPVTFGTAVCGRHV